MSEVTKLGQTFTEFQERDAVHVAVASVVADARLYPGEHIGFVNDGDNRTVGHTTKNIGIVDPFLPHYVEKGDIFWMFLYPQTITSLRHNWTHPAFTEENTVLFNPGPVVTLSKEDARKQKSIQWVKDYADRVGLSYSQLIAGAEEFISHGDYLNYGSLLEGEYLPDEFWDHYETITDTEVSDDDKRNFFSCSC